MAILNYKAWELGSIGGSLQLRKRTLTQPRPDGLIIRVLSAMVLSYMNKVIDGSIAYATPKLPFVPGTNAIGIVEWTGSNVAHVRPGERVFLSPHLVADTPAQEPPQILIGLTAMGATRCDDIPEGALQLQAAWPDGVFAELAHWPAACVTPLPGMDNIPAERLIGLAKAVVAYGGICRACLRPGQTIAINGATGSYGSAGVMVALSMGAARVVAVGRNRGHLEALAEVLGPRVAVAAVGGTDGKADIDTIQTAAGGALDCAVDLLGQASSTATTSAVLRSLRRGGRLVLMGSASAPLEIGFGEMLSNNWEVVGNFMYPKTAPADLAALVRSGLLDLTPIRIKTFPFTQLPEAIEYASKMRGLDLTTIQFEAEL